MCSIGDDIHEEVKNCMEKLDNITVKICNKCRDAKPNVLLRHKDGYCKTCFLNGTLHKFKAFLGKHRFIKKDDNVLVNYKIGHPITSLLSFLRSGIDTTTPKQLKFNPTLLYIERNYHMNVLERINVLKRISEHVKQFNFPIYFVSFLDYVTNSKISIKTDFKDLLLNDCDVNVIRKICANPASATVEAEFYKQMEYQLLLKVAKEKGYQHIFMCDIAVNVASQILTNISLGRGSYLEMEIGVCDKRDPNINIIKPLRSFDIKELALFNFFNNINPIAIRQDQIDIYSSVQNLMTSFVQNLQVNFPSTITTVVKTGDKLSMDENLLINEKCRLCLLPIQSRNIKLTSAEATDFSHWLSTYKSNSEIPPVDRYNKALASFKRNDNRYCFSCSKISKYLIKE